MVVLLKDKATFERIFHTSLSDNGGMKYGMRSDYVWQAP